MEWVDLLNEFNPIETAWLKIRGWNPEAIKPSAITYLANVFPQLRHAAAPVETPQQSKKKVATLVYGCGGWKGEPQGLVCPCTLCLNFMKGCYVL